ncbi:MAG: YIP1 family protein [Tannerella sp.]|jgi:hypothetical protein|nr:YIP1 family protein [Tannerella sp.]
MFKELFYISKSLIINPAASWAKLDAERPAKNDKFLSDYVYPFIGLMAAAAFVGLFVSEEKFSLESAIKASLLAILAATGGFFLTSYLINELNVRMFHLEKDILSAQRFTGYSSCADFCVNIIYSIFPSFFILPLLKIYTCYIVWEGSAPYMKIVEADRLKYTGIASGLIVFVPWVLVYLIGFLMPGLS